MTENTGKNEEALYDLAVIGAGPGGYVCAIRAAQNGLKVVVIEGRETLGGTCLNVGCIPSKALLHASHEFHVASHDFATLGIKVNKPKVDWKAMQAFKDEVVAQNVKGIDFLFRKNGIERITGWGRIVAPGTVAVEGREIRAKNIVIATGSVPASLPGVEIDEKKIVSSTGALSLARVPGRMVVIGAGVIGLELGSVYARLGTEVTVIEYLDRAAPALDGELARGLVRALRKQGMKFVLGAAVESVAQEKGGLSVAYTQRKNGKSGAVAADVVLVATGRKPFTEGLGLEELGVRMTGRGQIEVDDRWQTSVPGIHAIGDVVPGPMLAHKAEEEGVAVADLLAGRAAHVDHDLIPSVVYTAPEAAGIGATEEALKESGRAYKVGKFNFMGNGRAKASLAAEGFVKILADAETDRLLGAHILGPVAGEMIHEIAVAMEFGAAAEDIALTCHAHPTFSEAVREAALACGQGPIHA